MVAPPEIDTDDPSGSQTEYKVEKRCCHGTTLVNFQARRPPQAPNLRVASDIENGEAPS